MHTLLSNRLRTERTGRDSLWFALRPAILLLIGGLSGCGRAVPGASTEAGAPAAPVVVAGVAPVSTLVAAVAGSGIEVVTLVPPGRSPHSFEPSPTLAMQVSQSRVFFTVGLVVERRLVQQLAERRSAARVVDLRAGLSTLEGGCEHDPAEIGGHDPDHEGGGEVDPHIWMDPRRMIVALETIRSSLAAEWPEHGSEFARGAEAATRRLRELDSRLSDMLAPCRGRAFFVFHPSYGYLADAYGLRQIAFEIEGKEPTPRRMVELVDLARREHARVLFYEPQFPRSTVDAVARTLSARVERLEPLRPDYFENLEQIGARLAAALEPGPP